MQNKIPKDFAAKPITKSMAYPPVKIKRRGQMGPAIVFILAVPLCASLLIGYAAILNTISTLGGSTADNAAIIPPTMTAFQPVRNTAQPPEPTAEPPTPWPSPYPTFTHTPLPIISDNMQCEPIIEYVDRAVEVTVIIARVITSTPRPITKTPIPATATPIPLVIQEVNQKIEHRMRLKEIGVNLLEFVTHRGTLTFLVIVICGYVLLRQGSRKLADWMEGAPTVSETTQTVGEIGEDVETATIMSAVPGVSVGELREIRLMLAQKFTPTQIQMAVYKYTGGSGPNSAQQKVDRALEYWEQQKNRSE